VVGRHDDGAANLARFEKTAKRIEQENFSVKEGSSCSGHFTSIVRRQSLWKVEMKCAPQYGLRARAVSNSKQSGMEE
jgi:hypothetical protein